MRFNSMLCVKAYPKERMRTWKSNGNGVGIAWLKAVTVVYVLGN
jgi:hypothetical protein